MKKKFKEIGRLPITEREDEEGNIQVAFNMRVLAHKVNEIIERLNAISEGINDQHS